MEMQLDDTIGGFNAFVREQAPLGGTLSLYTFSDKCVCEYKDVPIENVKPLTRETYIPEGCTALYDSMGKILKEYSKAESGTFVILTDGQENSSRKFTKNHVKDLIEVSKLDVIYVGVDIDDAVDMGIQTTMTYDACATHDIFRSVSESVAVNVLRQTQSQPVDSVCSTTAIDSKNPRCTSQ
jgi:hypothetical protein